MNIAEILKDFPKGTKLYSPVYGEVEFLNIDNDNSRYPIVVKINDNCRDIFTLDGRISVDYDGECMLFPSKDNRDWSTFKVPKKHEFKPFDKVLVRHDDQYWTCDLFSYYCDDLFVCVGSSWEQCIPYKGNEYLLGTTNNPD